MTRPHAAIGAMLVLLLTACASGGGGTFEPMPTDSPDGTDGAIGPTPGDDGGAVSQTMLDDLVDQASTETGVPVDEIEVLAAEAVTWSDGSIGCPEEGMGYTQALVPGFRVMLEVAGERIQYHAASDGAFFPCDNPSEPVDDGTVDR